MTIRRLDELPVEHAAPILDLVEQVRAAVDVPDGSEAAWAEAEAGQARIRTGYKAARRTLSAGQYAAHALRVSATRAAEAVVAGPDKPVIDSWTSALINATGPIGSWDWDERMQGALDLRRTFKDLPEPAADSVRPVRAVAAWLTHAGGNALVPATARLAALTLDAHLDRDVLAASWYATHGARLLDALSDGGGPTTGRGDVDEAHRRDVLRAAVRGVHAAKLMGNTELARTAEITRRTLMRWL